MKHYGIIYKITNNVNGKVYIGQTIQPLKYRKKDHLNSSERLSHLVLYKAFKKYGKDNFLWEEIDHADTKEELDRKEKYYIALVKATNKRCGYNMTFGGEGGRHLDGTKQKISNSLKGRVVTEKTREKLSRSLIGKYIQENASWWGRKHTDEEKRKIGQAQLGEKNHNFGKKASEETIKKMSEAKKGEKHWNHKRVINLSTGEVFISAVDASQRTGIDNSLIGKCCKGLRKSAGGFQWAYKPA